MAVYRKAFLMRVSRRCSVCVHVCVCVCVCVCICVCMCVYVCVVSADVCINMSCTHAWGEEVWVYRVCGCGYSTRPPPVTHSGWSFILERM